MGVKWTRLPFLEMDSKTENFDKSLTQIVKIKIPKVGK